MSSSFSNICYETDTKHPISIVSASNTWVRLFIWGHHSIVVQVRGKLVEVSFPLPLRESQGLKLGYQAWRREPHPLGCLNAEPHCISFNCWNIHLLHIGGWRLVYMRTTKALANVWHLWKPVRLLWRPREGDSYLGELELDPKFLTVKWDSGSSHHRGPPRISGGQSHGQPTGGPAPHEYLGGGPRLLRLPYQKPLTERLTVYFLQLRGLTSVTQVRKSPWPPSWGLTCFQRPFCSRNHPTAPYFNTIVLMIMIAA